MKVLIIDNYDSFTYNLVHLVRNIMGEEPTVVRNDKLNDDRLRNCDKILLSPGPGLPDEAGMLKKVIQTQAPDKSILGVCLGMQAIAEIFGARLENLKEVRHGIPTEIITGRSDGLFEELPDRFSAAAYHSWVVSKKSFPDSLQITAEDQTGIIMAISHNVFDVHGLQFHPESVLTKPGRKIIENWLFNKSRFAKTPDSRKQTDTNF